MRGLNSTIVEELQKREFEFGRGRCSRGTWMNEWDFQL